MQQKYIHRKDLADAKAILLRNAENSNEYNQMREAQDLDRELRQRRRDAGLPPDPLGQNGQPSRDYTGEWARGSICLEGWQICITRGLGTVGAWTRILKGSHAREAF